HVVARGAVLPLPHAPTHRCRVPLPWTLDHVQSASMDAWRGALAQWFHGDDDADAKAEFLAGWVGAALFGVATRYGVCPLLVGDGDNGKSVFLRIVRRLFPADTTGHIPPRWLVPE